jgi:nucleoside-diphosphate-sugar epimerase
LLLVTGGSSFIGRAVIRHLTESGREVRTLLRPSRRSPNLPQGVPIDVALSSLGDLRGLRAAMVGVRGVIHLAAMGSLDEPGRDLGSEVEGTRNLAHAAADAGVDRFIYLSVIGADRASAYRLLRRKAQSEHYIQESGIPHSILRISLAYGRGDSFTSGLATLISISPGILFVPGDGDMLLQPLWVDDLATCIHWMVDGGVPVRSLIELGGPEYFSLRQLIEMVSANTGSSRVLASIRPPYLRAMAALLERLIPAPPLSIHWLDYLAASRIAPLDTVPRVFGLQPARMEERLGYLRGVNWGWRFIRRQFQGRNR